MICAIAAVDENWGIGFNGQLLEDIPEDKAHFKELTNDNIVIMGRKTWDSLDHKPLPGRMNIIITHGARPENEQDNDKVNNKIPTRFCCRHTCTDKCGGTI